MDVQPRVRSQQRQRQVVRGLPGAWFRSAAFIAPVGAQRDRACRAGGEVRCGHSPATSAIAVASADGWVSIGPWPVSSSTTEPVCPAKLALQRGGEALVLQGQHVGRRVIAPARTGHRLAERRDGVCAEGVERGSGLFVGGVVIDRILRAPPGQGGGAILGGDHGAAQVTGFGVTGEEIGHRFTFRGHSGADIDQGGNVGIAGRGLSDHCAGVGMSDEDRRAPEGRQGPMSGPERRTYRAVPRRRSAPSRARSPELRVAALLPARSPVSSGPAWCRDDPSRTRPRGCCSHHTTRAGHRYWPVPMSSLA